jgi:hypothetical protein
MARIYGVRSFQLKTHSNRYTDGHLSDEDGADKIIPKPVSGVAGCKVVNAGLIEGRWKESEKTPTLAKTAKDGPPGTIPVI